MDILEREYDMKVCLLYTSKRECVAKRMSVKFNELWVGAEVMLFVLVGAKMCIRDRGLSAIALPLYMTIVIAFKQPTEMTNSIAGILSLPQTCLLYTSCVRFKCSAACVKFI